MSRGFEKRPERAFPASVRRDPPAHLSSRAGFHEQVPSILGHPRVLGTTPLSGGRPDEFGRPLVDEGAASVYRMQAGYPAREPAPASGYSRNETYQPQHPAPAREPAAAFAYSRNETYQPQHPAPAREPAAAFGYSRNETSQLHSTAPARDHLSVREYSAKVTASSAKDPRAAFVHGEAGRDESRRTESPTRVVRDDASLTEREKRFTKISVDAVQKLEAVNEERVQLLKRYQKMQNLLTAVRAENQKLIDAGHSNDARMVKIERHNQELKEHVLSLKKALEIATRERDLARQEYGQLFQKYEEDMCVKPCMPPPRSSTSRGFRDSSPVKLATSVYEQVVGYMGKAASSEPVRKAMKTMGVAPQVDIVDELEARLAMIKTVDSAKDDSTSGASAMFDPRLSVKSEIAGSPPLYFVEDGAKTATALPLRVPMFDPEVEEDTLSAAAGSVTGDARGKFYQHVETSGDLDKTFHLVGSLITYVLDNESVTREDCVEAMQLVSMPPPVFNQGRFDAVSSTKEGERSKLGVDDLVECFKPDSTVRDFDMFSKGTGCDREAFPKQFFQLLMVNYMNIKFVDHSASKA
jgi:hypothetical protein